MITQILDSLCPHYDPQLSHQPLLQCYGLLSIQPIHRESLHLPGRATSPPTIRIVTLIITCKTFGSKKWIYLHVFGLSCSVMLTPDWHWSGNVLYFNDVMLESREGKKKREKQSLLSTLTY